MTSNSVDISEIRKLTESGERAKGKIASLLAGHGYSELRRFAQVQLAADTRHLAPTKTAVITLAVRYIFENLDRFDPPAEPEHDFDSHYEETDCDTCPFASGDSPENCEGCGHRGMHPSHDYD